MKVHDLYHYKKKDGSVNDHIFNCGFNENDLNELKDLGYWGADDFLIERTANNPTVLRNYLDVIKLYQLSIGERLIYIVQTDNKLRKEKNFYMSITTDEIFYIRKFDTLNEAEDFFYSVELQL